jgi:hypothetical protein
MVLVLPMLRVAVMLGVVPVLLRLLKAMRSRVAVVLPMLRLLALLGVALERRGAVVLLEAHKTKICLTI